MLPIFDNIVSRPLIRKKKPAELFAEAMQEYRKPKRAEFDLVQSTKLALFGMQVVDGKLTTVDSHLKEKFPK